MRAQATFFVIIGVLMLIAIASIIMVFSFDPVEPVRDLGNIQLFLEGCIGEGFAESLYLAGMRGGYITIPPAMMHDQSYFSAYDAYTFPLWRKPMGSAVIDHTPDDAMIARQIEEDVRSKVDACIRRTGADQSSSPYVEVSLSDARNRLTIRPNAYVDGVLIEPFEVSNSLPVKDSFDMAKMLVDTLIDEGVLSDINYRVIALDDAIPTTAIEINRCSPRTWRVDEVEESYEKTLETISRVVRFDGAPIGSPILNRLSYDVITMPNIKVAMEYDQSFGGRLEAERSNGGLMTSFVTRNEQTGFCDSSYSFWYDTEFPVMFTMRLDRTEPFYVRFALPIHARRNTLDALPDDTVRYCDQRTFNPLRLTIVDDLTLAPVSASGFIECGPYSCAMNGDIGVVEDRPPSRCAIGTLTIFADGYEPKSIEYRSNQFSTLDTSTVRLDPLRTLRIDCAGCDFTNIVFIARIGSQIYPFVKFGSSLETQLPMTGEAMLEVYYQDGALIEQRYDAFSISSGHRDITIRIEDTLWGNLGAYINALFSEVIAP